MKVFRIIKPKGCLIEGTIFSDGTTIIKWIKSKNPAISIYNSFNEFADAYLIGKEYKSAITEINLDPFKNAIEIEVSE